MPASARQLAYFGPLGTGTRSSRVRARRLGRAGGDIANFRKVETAFYKCSKHFIIADPPRAESSACSAAPTRAFGWGYPSSHSSHVNARHCQSRRRARHAPARAAAVKHNSSDQDAMHSHVICVVDSQWQTLFAPSKPKSSNFVVHSAAGCQTYYQ